MYPCTSSGLKTADAAIVARPCILHSVTLIAAAANSSVVLYDHASAASGTVVAKIDILIAQEKTFHLADLNIECSKGIYMDITGASAEAIINYSLL